MQLLNKHRLLTEFHARLFLLVSITIMPLALPAQDQLEQATNDTAYELVRLDWEGKLKAGGTLILDNRWGDIRLRQAGGDSITFHAVMQKIGQPAKTAELKVEKEGNNVTLRIVYPDDQQPQNPKEGRVDAALLIPTGIHLEVIADKGKVSSKKMEIPIKLKVTENAATLKTSAPVNIDSTSGKVDILFVPGEHTDQGNNLGQIKTLSGDINISYYPSMAMRFKMLSGRAKTTNDLTLLRNRELKDREVHMHTGNNPGKLYIQSDTGYIRLINTGSESN